MVAKLPQIHIQIFYIDKKDDRYFSLNWDTYIGLCLHISKSKVRQVNKSQKWSQLKPQTDGACHPLWIAVNGNSLAPSRLLVNINERHKLCKRPYLFSYLLSDPDNRRQASINITLPHPQISAPFLLSVNDVYSCACVAASPPLWTAAIAHDGAGPQAGTQLAGQTNLHLLGVGRAAALKSTAACSDLLLDTSRFFFFFTHHSPTQELYFTGWLQA